jgi:thiosulfate dehydrogenase [quinone] large subunit
VEVHAVFGTQAAACDENMQALLEGTVMTATTQPVQSGNEPPKPSETSGTRTPHSVDAPGSSRSRTAGHVFGGLARISLGWVFLWAFLDKTFGLGYATESKDAWIDGGSPTFGFLSFGAAGPFKGVYNSIAGDAWADWLFMLGLLFIGVALVLGVFMNLAAAAGALLLVMMWTAVLPPENNPFMDDHLIYALTLGLLASLGAGRWFGLGHRWEQTSLVRRTPFLR